MVEGWRIEGSKTSMTVINHGGRLEVTIAAAIHLLELGDVTSVHIVLGSHATFDQFKQAHDLAAEHGLTMTVRGVNGMRLAVKSEPRRVLEAVPGKAGPLPPTHPH
jgi:hypothetical protein